MEYLLYFISFIFTKLIIFNKNVSKVNFNRILIVKLDHIGDVVTSLPSVYSIRKRFPDAVVTFLTGEWSKDVLKNNPYINNIEIYNSNRFNRERKNRKSIIQRIRYLRSIFKKRYDLIAGLRDDWLTLIFSLIYFPKARVDRGTVRIKLKYENTLGLIFKSEKNNKTIHEIDTNLKIAEMAGSEAIGEKKFIFLSEGERDWAEEFLSSKGLKEKKFVIISPGAKWKYRRWDTRNFALLADRIREKFGLEILISGSKGEVDTAEDMRVMMKEKGISVAGKIDIRQTLSLLEKALICITNDSGMVHLTSGLNIPVVALFGAQDPMKFGPWSDINAVYHKKVECFPCSQKKCKLKDNPCINLIEEDEVFSGVREILNSTQNVEVQ